MDAATQVLLNYIRTLDGPTLWLVDEQIDSAAIATVAEQPNLFVLGNRSDVIAASAARGMAATLNDFDVASMPDFKHAVFRVAKEKALVHYAINTVLERLPVGGTLALSGYKNDGTKTYIEKAAARAQSALNIERDSGALLGVITRGLHLSGEPLPDQDYATPRKGTFSDDFPLWTKPGIFGWQKMDAGSAYLCDHLAQLWPQPPQRVLDLGCGYGYLTLTAAQQWPSAYFVATDNNITATRICERNISERKIQGRVECSDCADSISETFDAILCNPPFHQGFDHEQTLTDKFLRQTRRLLARNGRALFVVNQFIGLEKTAQPLFKHVDVIARNKSFKLVALGN